MAWRDIVRKKFKDIYDFTNVEFTTQKRHYDVICKKHGLFITTGYALVKNKACCPFCIKEQYKLREELKKKIFLEKYGVDNPMKDKNVKNKLKESMFNKYGVDNAAKLDSVQEKRKNTMIDKYGATSYIGSDEGKAHIEKINMERYGSKNFMQSNARFNVLANMKEKRIATSLKKYGADHYSKSDEAKKLRFKRKVKEIETKKQNGTLNTSSCEKVFYDRLCDYFGKNDIFKEYKSVKYPFYCDFYVKSLDLYIELNCHWTHGDVMYSEEAKDSKFYKELLSKQNIKYYKNAMNVWTKLDVEKRNIAKSNNLNYIIFWDTDLRDADVWFNCGVPVGKDYDSKYTWLPELKLEDSRNFSLTNSSLRITQIMKKYQFSSFYKREIELWNDNLMRSHIDLRMYMYYNRLMYKNKDCIDLTAKDLMQGMSISGILRAYSVFDNTLMDIFIDKYDIKSVCDMFAGWGERLLTCGVKGIKYDGIDIRDELKEGYDNMINNYNLNNVSFSVKDATTYDFKKNYDAVITCPPYLNEEIYSDEGLENLQEAEFERNMVDIFSKIYNNDVTYIALQTNQKCKSLFRSVMEQCGYELIDELTLDVKASHFCKNKKEYESMIIFKHK